MIQFNLIKTSKRLFTLITDSISKIHSLSFFVNSNFRIITPIVKKLMKSNTTITIQSAITSESKINKNAGNILIEGFLYILNQFKQISIISGNISITSLISFLPQLLKYITFNISNSLSINAQAEAAIYRPFGGLPDNPDYNPDGLDNLAFQDIDEWTLWTCDRIIN